MKLYVMRHGPAEDFAASGRDADRALTVSGRERVKAVAKLLRESDEAPRVIVSSPLVRALQTAEIVGSELGVHVETSRELAPSGDATVLVTANLREGRKRVMVVGHEPDLSALVATLLDAPFTRDMLKAMVVGLRTRQGEPNTLRFILDPKALHIERSVDSV